MTIPTTFAVLVTAALVMQPRGVVSKVTAGPADALGIVRISVEGSNPCGAVELNYGDGSVVTHAVQGMPATLAYEYTRVGEYIIHARGMGNCDGAASTKVRVDAVRPRREPPQPPPADERAPMRFQAMDDNGDGVITRAEWRGSQQSFDVHDWNNDRRLSGDEVRVGARRPSGRGRGAGSGRDTVVIVDGRDEWVDTGLTVRRGDTLTFDAIGTIYFSPQSPATGPSGVEGRRAPSRAPLPAEAIGALVARVGRSAPFLVGAAADGLRAPADGVLYLRVNDDVVRDNRGEFEVVISRR